MHLFEGDQHPMPKAYGCIPKNPLWLPNEEECFLGSCRQQVMDLQDEINSKTLITIWEFSKTITHIPQLKHKEELHCLTKYVHIQDVFDELPSAKVSLPYHL